MEALSYIDPIIKDGYGLTVTEIKDFVSSLAENYDPELYNRESKICVLHNVVIRFSSVLLIESMCP